MVHIRKLALINWHNKIIKTVTLLFSRRKKLTPGSVCHCSLQSNWGGHHVEVYIRKKLIVNVSLTLPLVLFSSFSSSYFYLCPYFVFVLSKYLLPPSLATVLWLLCRSVSSTQRCRQLLKPTGGDGGWWVFIWPDQGPSIAFSLVWNSRLRFEWSGQ